MVKIGLIGLDTSHVPTYARSLNDPNDPEHVPGGKVVVGCPAVSPDVHLSTSRVEKYTREVKEKYGVEIVDSAEAVAEACDAVFITSVDGRRHLEFYRKIAKYKRPTYIDKPMACSLADAKEIFRLAEEAGAPVMSCSSLRYADALNNALKEHHGAVIGCDVFGPMPEEPPFPGLFWYGIHCVEMMNVIMGRGCKQVRAFTNANFDLLTANWPDGRVATIRGMRKGAYQFGAVLHREKDSEFLDMQHYQRSWFARLLESIMANLVKGTSPIAKEDTLEIMRFIEAANESRKTGQVVSL